MVDETRLTIVAGEERYVAGVGGLTAPQMVVANFGKNRDLAAVLAAPTSKRVSAAAYVNHGRWLVDCPFGCGSAQYASRDDRRFWCIECNNAGTGEWVRVVWPADVAAVEAALRVRADQRNANWRPGETAADLVAENVANGVA